MSVEGNDIAVMQAQAADAAAAALQILEFQAMAGQGALDELVMDQIMRSMMTSWALAKQSGCADNTEFVRAFVRMFRNYADEIEHGDGAKAMARPH